MTATSEKVLEDWRGPEKASTGSYSYSGTGSKASTGATATKSSAAAAGRSASSSAPGSSAVKTTKKDSQAASASSTNEEDDTGVVVEVEIGSEKEADRARMQAKALGVMVEYDTPAEVAKSLGIDESELEKMSGVELANRLAKFHFSFGYGAARLHNKSEVEGIRKKAKDQTERMEHILDKQKKAQNHIWEYRQLVTILLALHTGGYKLTPTNVERALAAFPDLNAARRKDIQSAAQSLLEARDTKDLVARLVECFKKAEADDEKAAATS